MAEPFYPNLENTMNLARGLANDAYNAGAGEVLTDNAPQTIGYVNSSFAELQDRIENVTGMTLTKDNVLVLALDPVVNVDPSVQTSLSFTGYTGYNGADVDTNLTLPSDMMMPEEVWERQSGSNLPFVPMSQPQAGLPSRDQYQWLRQWEWRTDTMCFVGATVPVDIRIRYRCRQAFIAPNDTTPFTDVTINVLGSERALAYLIAYRYVASRQGDNAPMLRQEADAAIFEIIRRYTRQKQGIEYRRRSYGSNKGGNMLGRLPW